MKNNNEVKRTIIDGVEVIQEGGITHFIPVSTNDKPKTQLEYKSAWRKICDWWNDESSPKPFVKVMDLSDPLDKRRHNDFDDGSGSKHGVVIGMKFSF